MNLQDWAFIVTALAALGQVGALVAMTFQLRDFRKQTKHNVKATWDATRAHVWLEMLQIDKFFCEHPHLREKFYGPSTLAKDPKEAQQIEAAAEMMLDFAEFMMTQKHHLHRGFDGWSAYYKTLFTQSPALREYWKQNEGWFQDDMRDAINDLLKEIPEPVRRKSK